MTTHTINIKNSGKPCPKDLTIHKGDKIIFVSDIQNHSVDIEKEGVSPFEPGKLPLKIAPLGKTEPLTTVNHDGDFFYKVFVNKGNLDCNDASNDGGKTGEIVIND